MDPTVSSARWDPPPHFPPVLPAIPIRAPLSSDDVGSYVTTSSEPDSPSAADAWTGSDSASEDVEPVRVLLRSVSMPVAKVTDYDDEDDVSLEEEEDTIFSLVARVPLFDDVSPNPSASDDVLEPMQAKIAILAENQDQEQADFPYFDDVSPNPNSSEEELEPTPGKTVIVVEDPNQERAKFDAEEIIIVMNSEMEHEIAEVGYSDVPTLKPDGGKATEVHDSLDRGSHYVDDLKISANSVGYLDVAIEPEVGSASSLKYGAKDENWITEFKQTSGESIIKSSKSNIEVAVDFSDSISLRGGMLQADLGEISISRGIGREAERSPLAVETASEYAVTTESASTMSESEREFREQIELIRVKFLRLVLRLGYSPDDPIPAQVLNNISLVQATRLGMGNGTQTFSSVSARIKAMELEMQWKGESNFSCNILVIGKDGVGKSATINSIFGEEKSPTDPFNPKTTSVREILGIMDGMKIRVLDTPGLKLSDRDQASNRRILSSVKKCMKRCPPDAILYVDRIDTQRGDFNDLSLLRTINSILGSSIWSKTVIALTHAASAPPDGSNGLQLTYNFSVDQRSSLVRKMLREAVGKKLTNPVALVENHPLCKRDTQYQRVLPNGCRWVPHLLLLCYSSKIIYEATSLLNYQNYPLENFFKKSLSLPPMQYLSSLLQMKNHPKLSSEQGSELDVDLDEYLDQEHEEDEYDQLPPFKPLKNSWIAKLTEDQRRAYFKEYDYMEKFLWKKQWKQEFRRLKEIKKQGKDGQNLEDSDDKNTSAPAASPLLDWELPPSFNCDNPVYLYRSADPKQSSRLLTGPVSYAVNWDHDCSYDGVNLEKSLIVAGRFPAEVSAQVKKDKEVFIIHLESAVSAKHWRKNKTASVVSMTIADETVATGMKIGDQHSIGKRVRLTLDTCAVRTQNDLAFGVALEATRKKKDFTTGQALSTFDVALMSRSIILGMTANLKSSVSVGRNSNMIVGVSLSDKKSGKITVRTSVGSEQFHIVLVGFVAIAFSFFRKICSQKSCSS